MSLWPTLFANQGRDTALEATGVRLPFAAMGDLLAPSDTPPLELMTQDGVYFQTADGVYFGVSA